MDNSADEMLHSDGIVDVSVDVSVVVAAHNAESTLGDQLEALAGQTWERSWEIVVVDNGSTDSTARLVHAWTTRNPRVRLVDASQGRGPAYARNAGARSARGASLLFCDADDVVGQGWVAALGNALADATFVAGPVELRRLNPAWLADSRGTTGTEAIAEFDHRFPFASSCNWGIERSRFLEMGGFDEALTVGEDIDLSMRLHFSHVPLMFVRDATVHYRFRPTMGATFERAIAYGAARPVIAERWRSRGGEPISRWAGVRNWLWLIRHLGALRGRSGRARWLWVAGQRLGTLQGAWRVRRLYI